MKLYRLEKQHFRRISRQGGFTLLEIIVVVAIIGILAAIIAPRFLGRVDDANRESARIQMRNLETALKLYKVDNHVYPTTGQGLEALINIPSTGAVPKNYRKGGYLAQSKVPEDPWRNPYIYISPGSHGDFDIISLGADGLEGGEGNNADIKNWDL
ncbi:MAG: type II secretion system major pseudopilin GspG [Thermodesulfovibrionales bacterium]|nr:type II secretion system major pseudopilin GspG [Thermodesulfovibrionales bacterium]